jgi:hypothetical protein
VRDEREVRRLRDCLRETADNLLRELEELLEKSQLLTGVDARRVEIDTLYQLEGTLTWVIGDGDRPQDVKFAVRILKDVEKNEVNNLIIARRTKAEFN